MYSLGGFLSMLLLDLANMSILIIEASFSIILDLLTLCFPFKRKQIEANNETAIESWHDVQRSVLVGCERIRTMSPEHSHGTRTDVGNGKHP